MNEEHLLKPALSIPAKKSLKRWFPSGFKANFPFFIKSKYKKISDANNTFHRKQLLFIPSVQSLKDHHDSQFIVLLLNIMLSQNLERPISLSNHQLAEINLFMIHLKCLPVGEYNFFRNIEKQFKYFSKKLCCFIDTYNSKPLQIELMPATDYLNVQLCSRIFGNNLQTLGLEEILYLSRHEIYHVKKLIFSAYEFIMTLCQSFLVSRQIYLHEDNKGSLFQSIDDNNADLSCHAVKQKICEKENYGNKFLDGKLSLSLLKSLNKFDVPDILQVFAGSKKNKKEYCHLSEMNVEKVIKQPWGHFMTQEVLFPLVKYEMDYETITGSSEMLLPNVISIDLMDTSSPESEEKLNFSIQNILPDSSVKKKSPVFTAGSNSTENNYAESIELQNKNKSIENLNPLKKDDDAEDNLTQNSNFKSICKKDSFTDVNEEKEHVVPDIDQVENQVEEYPNLYEDEFDNLKALDKSKTSFTWSNSDYDQFSYPSGQQCNRPRRVGLSKRQKVKHLHKK